MILEDNKLDTADLEAAIISVLIDASADYLTKLSKEDSGMSETSTMLIIIFVQFLCLGRKVWLRYLRLLKDQKVFVSQSHLFARYVTSKIPS